MNNPSDIKFRENAILAVVRDAHGLTIHFREARKGADGTLETVRMLEPIRLAFAACSAAVLAEAQGYGMEVRLTRAAALGHDAKSGKAAAVAEKHAAVRELADFYATGTDAWAMSGGGGGGLSADTKALILALVRALGLSEEVAEEQVRGMSASTRDALRVDAEIKPALDAIYAERAAAAGDYAKGLIEKLKKL